MFKKLFFYPPVLAAISATVCISINIPALAEIRCPKNILRGLAKGLAGKAVINTTDAPNVGIIHNTYSLETSLR